MSLQLGTLQAIQRSLQYVPKIVLELPPELQFEFLDGMDQVKVVDRVLAVRGREGTMYDAAGRLERGRSWIVGYSRWTTTPERPTVAAFSWPKGWDRVLEIAPASPPTTVAAHLVLDELPVTIFHAIRRTLTPACIQKWGERL